MDDMDVQPHAGLLLDVFVKSLLGNGEEGGDLTRSCGRLTLLGVVDFETRPVDEEPDYSVDPKPREPLITVLGEEHWQAIPTSQAPPVWLVKKDGQRYVIPARPVAYTPDLEYTKPGGHYAASREGVFWLLLGTEFHGAVPVHDLKRPGVPSERYVSARYETIPDQAR
jgi:hypothetical protein